MPHEVGDFVLDTQSELGSGGYGKVVTAKNKSTGELVACKIISSSRMKTTAIQKEVDMMKKLQHPSIVGLRAHIADGKYQYIFMELGAAHHSAARSAAPLRVSRRGGCPCLPDRVPAPLRLPSHRSDWW